jgi:hypothetical protein
VSCITQHASQQFCLSVSPPVAATFLPRQYLAVELVNRIRIATLRLSAPVSESALQPAGRRFESGSAHGSAPGERGKDSPPCPTLKARTKSWWEEGTDLIGAGTEIAFRYAVSRDPRRPGF